ncbi:MAG: hypothetical protein DWQ01_06705 [Planctomycetota bacterium]|nr:MAG: hypothetical protein DWQ01_06705 [Planctomycetota bacterium]
MTAVAISGIGYLGPHGSGHADLAEAMAKGQQAFRPVDNSAGFPRLGGARMLAKTEAAAWRPWLSPVAARRLCQASRWTVAAAKMALQDAQWQPDDDPENLAVCLGSAFGPLDVTQRLLREIHGAGPESMAPFDFMESVVNAPAAQVAMAVGAKGPNSALCQREASGLAAVAAGYRWIQSGRAQRVLVATVDEMHPVLHSVLDRLGVLSGSRRGLGMEEACRPLDRRRNGLMVADGASVLLLESESALVARGGEARLWLRGALRAHDPSASTLNWGHDHRELAARLQAWLHKQPKPPQAVISGANGSRTGDALEALVLQATPAVRGRPVLAPKVLTGEYGGGFLTAATLIAQGQAYCVTNDFELDPALQIEPLLERSGPWPGPILISSLASAGSAIWLMVEPV